MMNKLDERIIELKGQYSQLKKHILYTGVFLFCSLFIVIRNVSAILFGKTSLFQMPILWAAFLAVVALFLSNLLINKLIKHTVSKFLKQYKEASKICNEIVDLVDWSNFRKRAAEDSKRIKAENAVDRFYRLREYKLFPKNTERSSFGITMFYIRIGYLMLMICTVVLMVRMLYIDLIAN